MHKATTSTDKLCGPQDTDTGHTGNKRDIYTTVEPGFGDTFRTTSPDSYDAGDDSHRYSQ